MYEKDSEWANLAFSVAESGLSEYEMGMLTTMVEASLEYFLKNRERK